jgi:hypothetical protein
VLSTGATCTHQPRSGPASRTSQNVTNNKLWHKLWHLDLHRMEPPGMPVWPASRALSYGFIVSCELDGWMDVCLAAGQLHFSNTIRVADDDLEIFDLNDEAQSGFVRAFSIFCKPLSLFLCVVFFSIHFL